MKFSFLLLTVLFFSIQSLAGSFIPKKGFVPDQKTALTIAEAVLLPVYGKKILKQKPFKVTQKGDLWIVDGTFHCTSGNTCKGGAAHVEIKKKTGEIINMIHGK